MKLEVVALFNLKGGQGKTTLAHHLAWMFSDLGIPVVAADLDPQGNLTQSFLGVERTAGLGENETLHGSLDEMLHTDASKAEPRLIEPGGRIGLLAGGPSLWALTGALEDAWTLAPTGNAGAGAALMSIRRVLKAAAEHHGAPLVLVDLAPNLDALNRAALIAADHLMVPIIPDALALKALKSMGEGLDTWREQWQSRKKWVPVAEPWRDGAARPLGYVVQMAPVYAGRPASGSASILREIPVEYGRWIAKSTHLVPRLPAMDDHCLGTISAMRSLLSVAADAGKPVLHLTPADGAIGSTMKALQRFRAELESVARRIAARVGVPLD